MKASNIIVLGVFTSILVWILIIFFITRQKLIAEIEHKKLTLQESGKLVGEKIAVETFHYIFLDGTGELTANQTGGYSYTPLKTDENIMEIRNDTLYLTLSGNRCRIEVDTLLGIAVQGGARMMFPEFKADTLSISAKDSSNIIISDLEVADLYILTKNNSSVYLYEVKGENANGDFRLKDSSRLIIGTMNGLSVGLKKDAEAEYYNR
jgi:hypothetical protein